MSISNFERSWRVIKNASVHRQFFFFKECSLSRGENCRSALYFVTLELQSSSSQYGQLSNNYFRSKYLRPDMTSWVPSTMSHERGREKNPDSVLLFHPYSLCFMSLYSITYRVNRKEEPIFRYTTCKLWAIMSSSTLLLVIPFFRPLNSFFYLKCIYSLLILEFFVLCFLVLIAQSWSQLILIGSFLLPGCL